MPDPKMAVKLILNTQSRIIHFQPGYNESCNTDQISEASIIPNDPDGHNLQELLNNGNRICKRCSP